ncbi:hypothetical protein T484DRAFT_1904133 [Baffinella frigidus]|nr:hypothetical protein T484DRAFT_1904133 [Cryptophyta sp. CCMP2293]
MLGRHRKGSPQPSREPGPSSMTSPIKAIQTPGVRSVPRAIRSTVLGVSSQVRCV